VKETKKALVKEHKRLVKVLKRPTKKSLKAEANKQYKELKRYENS
jgi:hypothetical protein